MDSPMWSMNSARKIAKRIVVTGMLVLETPAHFGNGDSDESVIALQTDSVDPSKPLLPGPSIAGALRAYLRQIENGYGKAEHIGRGDKSRAQEDYLTASLFGAPLGGLADNHGEQSRLLVDDSIGSKGAATDYRDGVRIAGDSRTAVDGGLYTFQTWAAGTVFNLRFELLILEDDLKRENDLKRALAIALRGFESGEIGLGARKKRGFGRGMVASWTCREYDMRNPNHLLDWLKGQDAGGITRTGEAFTALDVQGSLTDQPHYFKIEATFEIDGSLLIRTASDEYSDMPHLRSNGKPVLSGTSAAGAIRARAVRILNTLGIDTKLVEDMFGRLGDRPDARGNRNASASRVLVRESVINGGVSEMVQSRVSIDRFTGGALDTALFNEAPQWGGQVAIDIELRNPTNREIGLLLLILKDLWTGDLPLGGESSVGRGRLKGIGATLDYRGTDNAGAFGSRRWTLSQSAAGLQISSDDADWLSKCVGELTGGGAS